MSTLSTTNLKNPSSGSNNIVLDSSGRVLLNTSSALALGTALANYAFNIETLVGGAGLNHSIGAVRHGNNVAAGGPVITLGRSNGNAAGSVAAVVNNDLLGRLEFVGANGTNFATTGAQITGEVDGGTISTSSMPGRLVFSTTADGASSPTERFRISSTGAQSSVIPGGSTLYPSFDCRAWVNYSGNSSSIRSSGNVSSVTKTSVGQYTVNFSTAMPDINYSLCGSCKGVAATFVGVFAENHDLTRSASAIPVTTVRRDNGGSFDTDYVSVAIFR